MYTTRLPKDVKSWRDLYEILLPYMDRDIVYYAELVSLSVKLSFIMGQYPTDKIPEPLAYETLFVKRMALNEITNLIHNNKSLKRYDNS